MEGKNARLPMGYISPEFIDRLEKFDTNIAFSRKFYHL